MLWHSGAMVTIDNSSFDDDPSDPSGPDDDDLNRFADPTGHCPACGAEMWDDAPACPSCGELTGGQTLTRPPRQTEQRRLALAVVAIIVMAAILVVVTRCSALLG